MYSYKLRRCWAVLIFLRNRVELSVQTNRIFLRRTVSPGTIIRLIIASDFLQSKSNIEALFESNLFMELVFLRYNLRISSSVHCGKRNVQENRRKPLFYELDLPELSIKYVNFVLLIFSAHTEIFNIIIFRGYNTY